MTTRSENQKYSASGHISMKLMDAIREKMAERGMNQKQLSGILGISESRVSDLLSGRRDPNLQTAKKLRDNLGIPADFILDCYKR